MEEEDYSEEFYAIMKRKMPGILKWGWIIVGNFLLIICIGSYFMEYPNVVIYQVNLNQDTITSEYTGMMLLMKGEDSLFVPHQPVEVKLSQYSYLEYGVIRGYIANIQFNPKIKKNVATIIFPEGLFTSTGQTLLFQEGLTGYCEIVVGKEKLIKKILLSLLKLKPL